MTNETQPSPVAAFRAKMAAGDICIGASITLTDPHATDALGDSVDFFWIDLEHSMMSAEALGGHLLAAKARSKPALVRVPGSGTPFIKPVLDAGADGIIVPQVRSTAEVQDVVNSCRYPPLGERGYGPRVPSNYGRDGGDTYIERANREIFVAVQIENAQAFAALDEILAITGLDSIALGPWDLSASLGAAGRCGASDRAQGGGQHHRPHASGGSVRGGRHGARRPLCPRYGPARCAVATSGRRLRLHDPGDGPDHGRDAESTVAALRP